MRLALLKAWLGFCCVFISQKAVCQRVVISQNSGLSSNVVFGQERYHISESLYTNSEIGSANFLSASESIDKIGFFVRNVGNPSSISNLRIWMREVPSAIRSLTAATYSTTGYIQVFDGTVVADSVGLLEIPLSSSFIRTAGRNLMVLIERLDSVRHSGFVYATSNGLETASNTQSSRRYNDSTKPVLGTTSLTTTNFRPAISFIHVFPTDVAALSIGYPVASCYNTPQTVSVRIQNQGMNTVNSGLVSVTLRMRGANVSSFTVQNSQTLQSGETEEILFPNVNLNLPGTNTDTALITLTGDGTRYNDTISSSTNSASTLTTFPLSENMENAIVLVPYLSIEQGDRQLWKLQTNKYSNSDMTPDTLRPQSPGIRYMLFDSWSAPSSNGFISRMFSNCIKVPSPTPNGIPTTTVSFIMSHDDLFPLAADSLYLTVSADRGLTWTRLEGFSRWSATATTPRWTPHLVDISAYTGQVVQLGFEGVSKFGSAFGVDNIQVKFTNPVPLTLLDFKAWKEEKSNRLKWTTAQEWNMAGFDVERSLDGHQYEKIGWVKADGEGYHRTYDFEDNQPISGRQYYRLRMSEINQRYSYSPIVTIDRGELWAFQFENPVQGNRISGNVSTIASAELTFVLSDMNGKKLWAQKQSIKGNTPVSFQLPLFAPAGIYNLTITSSSETHSVKLMIP